RLSEQPCFDQFIREIKACKGEWNHDEYGSEWNYHSGEIIREQFGGGGERTAEERPVYNRNERLCPHGKVRKLWDAVPDERRNDYNRSRRCDPFGRESSWYL